MLGIGEASSLNVLLKSGRFGPYVQLGDGDEPKRSSRFPGWSPDSLTLEKAQQLLCHRAVEDFTRKRESISAGIGLTALHPARRRLPEASPMSRKCSGRPQSGRSI